jgi:hypothetical protein
MHKLNTHIFLLSVFMISSCGGGGGSGGDDGYSPPTPPANNAPSFAAVGTIAVAENTTAIGTITATDADNDTLTYSVTGPDASLISVVPSSGFLSFNNVPDYENPMDVGMDNDYEITLVASDGSATGSVGIVVSVTDVDDESVSAAISADNQSIKTYSQITLSWECISSSSAVAEGDWSGSKSLSGSENIYLSTSGTRTYTIKCIYEGGQEIASVQINVADITLKNVPSNISLFKDD